MPDNSVVLNNLAVAYDELGDSRAIDTALRAYESSPENPAIADTLGWIHVKRGDASSGLPYLEQAAAELAAIDEVRYHLGVALEETGDTARAREIYESLLANDTEYGWREDVEQRLTDLR